MIASYPLQWPLTQTRSSHQVISLFKCTQEQAWRGIERQLLQMGTTGAILTSNMKVRRDGYFYSNTSLNDNSPAVAIYFDYKGSRHCIAIDRYVQIKENIRAIEKTLEAIRGIERWGGGKIMETALGGFKELPSTVIVTRPHRSWFVVLDVDEDANALEVKQAYRDALKLHHPDAGGEADDFAEVQRAYKEWQEL